MVHGRSNTKLGLQFFDILFLQKLAQFRQTFKKTRTVDSSFFFFLNSLTAYFSLLPTGQHSLTVAKAPLPSTLDTLPYFSLRFNSEEDREGAWPGTWWSSWLLPVLRWLPKEDRRPPEEAGGGNSKSLNFDDGGAVG
jgi:hypothetical protein